MSLNKHRLVVTAITEHVVLLWNNLEARIAAHAPVRFFPPIPFWHHSNTGTATHPLTTLLCWSLLGFRHSNITAHIRLLTNLQKHASLDPFHTIHCKKGKETPKHLILKFEQKTITNLQKAAPYSLLLPESCFISPFSTIRTMFWFLFSFR